jgi:copper chaperone CopZ
MKKIPVLGPLLGAFLASLCCLGPAILFAFGVGSFGAARFFEKFHIYFYWAGFLIVGASFYFSLRKKEEACNCQTAPNSKTMPLQTGFKLLAFLAIFFAGSYALIDWIAPSLYKLHPSAPKTVSTPALPAKTVVALFSIHGMDCPMCTVGIQAQIGNLPGVYASRVSFKQKTGMVCYDPQKISPRDIQTAIHHAGYSAVLIKKTACPKPGSLSASL